MRPAYFTALLLCSLTVGCGDDAASAPAQPDAGTDSMVADTAVADTMVADAMVADTLVVETGAPTLCTEVPVGTVVKVTVSELQALIAKGEKLAIVDVREPSETSSGIIAGALLYPWSSGVLKAKHAELPTDRPLYVHCASGTRSALATDFLSKNGHGCVHDTQGGMMAWRAAGYPTVAP